MTFEQFLGNLTIAVVAGFVGGLVPAFFTFFFGLLSGAYDTHKKRREERIEAIISWINQLGYIESLYRLWAHQREWVERDAEGNLVFNAEGQPVIRQEVLEITEADEQALLDLLEVDSPERVLQREILKLRLDQTRAADAAALLDRSGEINRKMGQLYWVTVEGLDFWRCHKDFESFRQTMREATEYRRVILHKLDRKRGALSILGSMFGI